MLRKIQVFTTACALAIIAGSAPVVTAQERPAETHGATVNKLQGMLNQLVDRRVRAQLERYFDGVVAAFDRREGCPEGWSPFSAGYGRVIVGAGGPGDGLTKRDFSVFGGAETHTLTRGELPPHDHRVVGQGDMGINEWGHTLDENRHDNPPRLFVNDGPPWGNIKGHLIAKATGGGAPHNNMPPFVPLYFCKKSSPEKE